MDNSEIDSIVNEKVHNLRDRNILKSRFIDGFTYEKLAELYELSVRQVKRIVYKYEFIIFDNLK